MANFDVDILRELRDVQEVAIRTEKHPKNAVVIWVVVADDEVFVRSVRGTRGRWYRDLAAGGPATLGVCRPPARGAGNPGKRPRCGRPGHPRIPAEVSAEPLCAVDGEVRSVADHAAARTALTGRAWFTSELSRREESHDGRGFARCYGWRSKRSTSVRSIDHGNAERHQPCRVGRSSARRSSAPTRRP